MTVAQWIHDQDYRTFYGYELWVSLCSRGGHRPPDRPVIYMILGRLADLGWLDSSWVVDSEQRGAPPRRYFEVTDLGRSGFAALLRLEP